MEHFSYYFWITILNLFLGIGLFILFGLIVTILLDCIFYTSISLHNSIISFSKSTVDKMEMHNSFSIEFSKNGKTIIAGIVGFVTFFLLKWLFSDILNFDSAKLASKNIINFYGSTFKNVQYSEVLLGILAIGSLFGGLIILAGIFKLFSNKKQ